MPVVLLRTQEVDVFKASIYNLVLISKHAIIHLKTSVH